MQKSISGIDVKSAEKGEVSAVFSTFNVIDKDGDVTEPGAFKDGQEVLISAYGHTSWSGALPVGKGTIRQTKDEAIFEGQFFLNTTAGRDTFEVVKELGAKGEWSYGYDVEEFSFGKHDDQDVRFLKSLDVHEVSPVLLGAGVNTRTLGTKSLHDQIAEATGVVTAAIESAERVVALRAEKGKQLSHVNAESLGGLYAGMDRLKALLDAMTDEEESGEATSMEDIEAMAAQYRRAELFSSLNMNGA